MAKSAKSKPTKAKPQKKIFKKIELKKVEPKKIEPKKIEKKPEVKKKKIEPQPQAIPEQISDSVNLSDQEFDAIYKLAGTVDFKEGQTVFTKERSGDKWIAKEVSQIGVVGVDFAAINDLVLRGLAYIKK